VTGRSHYEVLRRRLLDPLKLTLTTPATRRDPPGLVPGYNVDDAPFGLPSRVTMDGALAFNPVTEWTGGGLVTNSQDLARWGKALYEGKALAGAHRDALLNTIPKDSSQQARYGPDVRYGLGVTTRSTRLGPGATEAGEEDFTSRYVDAVLQAEQRVAPGLRIGLRGRVREEAITEVEADGRLSGAAVPGAEGGTTLGLGLVVTRDTRDRLFYPHQGTYVTASVVPHSGALGSDFVFTRAVVDARYYVPVGNHVIGLQGYGKVVSGTAPFTILPRLGGPRQLCGYREGRFRDDVFAAVQGEWRFPLWGRSNGAVFAGTGAVAPRLEAVPGEGGRRRAPLPAHRRRHAPPARLCPREGGRRALHCRSDSVLRDYRCVRKFANSHCLRNSHQDCSNA
jgi:hypothetical protein